MSDSPLQRLTDLTRITKRPTRTPRSYRSNISASRRLNSGADFEPVVFRVDGESAERPCPLPGGARHYDAYGTDTISVQLSTRRFTAWRVGNRDRSLRSDVTTLHGAPYSTCSNAVSRQRRPNSRTLSPER